MFDVIEEQEGQWSRELRGWVGDKVTEVAGRPGWYRSRLGIHILHWNLSPVGRHWRVMSSGMT